jgi:hypothetical protein
MLSRSYWFDANFRPCEDVHIAALQGTYARPTPQHCARNDLYADFQWALSRDQQRGTHDGIVT